MTSPLSYDIPVVHDADEFHSVQKETNAPVLALFLAFRDPESKWANSIPRQTLNLWDARFALVPGQIAPTELPSFYPGVARVPRLEAMNHTAPLKDHAALRDFLGSSKRDDSRVLDVCVRNRARSSSYDAFRGVELNGPTFVQWLTRTEDTRRLARSTFVIRGKGGAGSAIKRALVAAGFTRQIMIERDSTKPRDHGSLNELRVEDGSSVVLIDATGDASTATTQELQAFFWRPVGQSVFIDLRTATHSPRCVPSELTQWTSYDGSAWSFANDWAFYCLAMGNAGFEPRGTAEEFAAFSAGIVEGINRCAITEQAME